MKCAICNKEITGGFIVERECLEKLQAEIKDLKAKTRTLCIYDGKKFVKLAKNLTPENMEFIKQTIRKSLSNERSELDKLQAENAELKARLIKSIWLPSQIYKAVYEQLPLGGNRKWMEGVKWVMSLFLDETEARLKELEEKK